MVGILMAALNNTWVEWLLPSPLVALELVALFHPHRRGWPRRFAMGTLGLFTTALVALFTIDTLRKWTDWYDYPADQGALLYFAILVALAALPGAIAASCTNLRRGIALAGSFSATLCLILLALMLANPGRGQPWGVVVLLLLGPTVGAVVGSLGARLRAGD